MHHSRLALIACTVASMAAAANAATLYSENFDADNTANWKFNSSISGDTAANNTGGEANFYFDYSSYGIPAAPGGTSTRGMRIESNIAGTAVFSGGSASPLGLTLPAQYTLKAMVWQNTVGPFPGGGSGSTQLTHMTVGASGNDASFAGGTLSGIQGSVSGDGGTNPDYRVYSSAYPDGAGAVVSPTRGVYAAGTATQNNSLAYYVANFPGQAPPATETALYAVQNGKVADGAPAFKWREWTMTKTADYVQFYIDGVRIASIPASLYPTTFGDNIAFGQADINATSTTDTNRLIFGLFDNITVSDVVPEPASLTALGGAAAVIIRRRRK